MNVNIKLVKTLSYFFSVITALTMISCTDDEYVEGMADDFEDDLVYAEDKTFHIIGATPSATYILASDIEKLVNPSVSFPFSSSAFQIQNSVDGKVLTSSSGTYVYTLNTVNGTFYKYKNAGNNNYTLQASLNITYALATNSPNVIKVNDQQALLTNLVGTNKLRLALVNLESFAISFNEELDLPSSSVSGEIVAINSALVKNNKIYLGVKKMQGTNYAPVETLVVDYPSLQRPYFISSNFPTPMVGFTSGENVPTMHMDSNGSIFQIVNVDNTQGVTHIVKINNDAYNPSFKFDLDLLLGEATYAKGWFYVANGVGYVPYLRKSLGNENSNNWAIARVDLYNHTATVLNLPSGLNLKDFRNAIVRNNSLVITLANPGQSGNIYVFDATNPSPEGFKKGASIDAISGGMYLGLY
jgi:hypothetical protein